MRSILEFVPAGITLSPEQVDLLLRFQAAYRGLDVAVIVAPTAFGKTLISYIIARWIEAQGRDCNILHPDNVLVDQFTDKHPDVPVLHRQDAYRCETFKHPCPTTKKRCKKYCSECPLVQAKREVERAGVRTMNYYTYWSRRLYAHALIFDEAHKVVDMLSTAKSVTLWHHDWNFPLSLATVADVIAWAQQRNKKKPDSRLRDLVRDIVRIKDGSIVEYGKGYRRGEQDVTLEIRPPTATQTPPWLWPPHRVKKLILMSATISRKDVEELGLGNRRVVYLDCAAPIPPENRPLVYRPRYNMAFKYRAMAVPHLAKHIRELLAQHPEKGLIHVPYAVAEQLRGILHDPRLMWHEKSNKAAMLDLFKQSDPAEGRVFVASGLYEGVDLPYTAAGWQLIGVVPWESLADERVKQRAATDPDWLDWQTLKKIIQATGRIVRAVDDKGTTYLGDVNFETLLRRDRQRKQPLMPDYFRAALNLPGR